MVHVLFILKREKRKRRKEAEAETDREIEAHVQRNNNLILLDSSVFGS
jgi:hypothetical protein